MSDDYALNLLKQEKRSLLDRLLDIDVLENQGKEINEKIKPLYKQQLRSIEQTINFLEARKFRKPELDYGVITNTNLARKQGVY